MHFRDENFGYKYEIWCVPKLKISKLPFFFSEIFYMSQNLQPWKIIILAKIKGIPKQTVSQIIQYTQKSFLTAGNI